MIRIAVTLTIAILASTSAFAQEMRAIPQTNPGDRFVEVIEQAGDGDWQIIPLKVTYPYCQPFNPYVSTAKPLIVKSTPDLLFYDKRSGSTFLIKTLAFTGEVSEMFENWYYVTPGFDFRAADIDGDGSDDLIGFNAQRNLVSRVIRKNPTTFCTPQQ